MLPWEGAQATEINAAFTLENNLVLLPTLKINGKPGRFFFASAAAHTVVDPRFAQTVGGREFRLELNARESVPVRPVILPLGEIGDALIGADASRGAAVTLDYSSGLLSFQKEGIHSDFMTLYEFDGEPTIVVEVDGRSLAAVVDTASPDTLVLPGASGRASAHVVIAGVDFGSVDVARANIPRARIGNRLLSRFLVTIDYGRRQVGLWQDPRVAR